MVVSIDFPFSPPWHELCDCYEGSGWRLQSREIMRIANRRDNRGDGEPWRCVVAEFDKRSGQQGFLVYCMFDDAGAGIDPLRSNDFWAEVAQRLGERQRWSPRPIFQVQAFVSSAVPLGAAEKDSAQQAFAELRETLRECVVSPALASSTAGGP